MRTVWVSNRSKVKKLTSGKQFHDMEADFEEFSFYFHVFRNFSEGFPFSCTLFQALKGIKVKFMLILRKEYRKCTIKNRIYFLFIYC